MGLVRVHVRIVRTAVDHRSWLDPTTTFWTCR